MSGAANRPAAGRLTLVAAILASTFLMGSSFVCGKALLNAGFPPLLLAGWRFLAPVFAQLLSFVLLDSALSWLQVLGAVFIALTIWLVNRQVPDRAADFSKLALKGARDGSGSR